jgi:phthiocerol/phenolphthiocerol synthesis type-I polyketide synthase E
MSQTEVPGPDVLDQDAVGAGADSDSNSDSNSDAATRIGRIWSQILEVDRIEDQDDFFDLGGSSIDAVVMLRMVRAELSVSIELADFFGEPTLQDLAAAARRAQVGPAQ